MGKLLSFCNVTGRGLRGWILSVYYHLACDLVRLKLAVLWSGGVFTLHPWILSGPFTLTVATLREWRSALLGSSERRKWAKMDCRFTRRISGPGVRMVTCTVRCTYGLLDLILLSIVQWLFPDLLQLIRIEGSDIFHKCRRYEVLYSSNWK